MSTFTQNKSQIKSNNQQTKKITHYINGSVAQTKANYFDNFNNEINQGFNGVDEKSFKTRQDSDCSEDNNKDKGAPNEQFGDFGSSVLEKTSKNTHNIQKDRSR